MEQWLPRGYNIADDNRIKRVFSQGDNWQIYLTNRDNYVLAVTSDLYRLWIDEYSLPENIFRKSDLGYYIFCGTNTYLVSSLKSGPYPETGGQVEAFSLAFSTAARLYPNADLQNAVYIEEYSLLLPTEFNLPESNNAVAYGKWLTGGINIPVTSIKRISQIASWLNKDFLYNSVKLAGFDVEPIEYDDNSVLVTETKTETVAPMAPPTDSVCNGQFSLIGRPDLEQFFNDNIIDIVTNREAYARMGINFPGATILYGPPGCGKTYAIDRLAEFLGWQRFDIDSSTIASSYIHDTPKKISEVFNSAIKAAPSILVIDEMEAFLMDRNSSGPGTHHIEEVAEFLRRIPEAISKGVLIFAMTNMLDSIDPAILRRGRFDHIIEVKMASKEELTALFSAKLSELPTEDDVTAEDLAVKLDKHPLSDVAFVIREAGRLAVKKKLDKISKECFDEAVNALPKETEEKHIGF